MEILAIALSGLLSVFSGGGIVLDLLTSKNIRSQIVGVEEQAVRIDNVPSYQIVSGKLQKVRVATRGLEVKLLDEGELEVASTLKPSRQNLRIEALELETDAIAIERDKLNLNDLSQFQEALQQPLQGAVRIVLTEKDLNRVLQSELVTTQLQSSLNRLVAGKAGSTNIVYELKQPHLEFLPDNRIGIQFKLSRAGFNRSPATELAFAINLGIRTVNGRGIEFIEPSGTVNQRPMSSRLLKGFAEGIGERLNLEVLETNGILARLLQLKISQDKIELAGFARMETKEAELDSIGSEFSSTEEIN